MKLAAKGKAGRVMGQFVEWTNKTRLGARVLSEESDGVR